MSQDFASSASVPRVGRAPPYSEEAERGVLGSILLDAGRVMDLCIERQLISESFYVSALRTVYEAMLAMARESRPIDVLTVAERLKDGGHLDSIGGPVFLDRLIDFTPTAAHAEYYIDIVRQKHLLRAIIECVIKAESACYESEEDAEALLGRIEQSFFDITEQQHGSMTPWPEMVKDTIAHIDVVANTRKGYAGIPTGFKDIDAVLAGLRPGNLIILAARPSMGKTSLAMNIVENVAQGKDDPDRKGRPVGIFSLEMSKEDLVMRLLCGQARVQSTNVARGFVTDEMHRKMVQAADTLMKMPLYLDDTAALDVMELRARARRMKKKYDVELIVVDYLQLLHSTEYARQGRQIEISNVSGSLKAMAKELRIPVLVISQLSRAPETRDKLGKPKLSDLRDSGSIEQDADVVMLLRRPCKYEEDKDFADKTLAVVDVAKHRNGPTKDDVRMVFEEEFTCFKDRAHGVDAEDLEYAPEEVQ